MPDSKISSQYVSHVASRRAIDAAADLPTTYARDGSPTLTWANCRLHSAVNPHEEFVRSFNELESTRCSSDSSLTIHCILFAPGLGYSIKALDRQLRDKYPSHDIVISCIEAVPEIARKALELRLWEPTKAHVEFYCSECLTAVPNAVQKAITIVIRSTPGYRLNAGRYESLLSAGSATPTGNRKLRILVPTPIYGGSTPIARYCASAFTALGHDVELLDFSVYDGMLKHAKAATSNTKHQSVLQSLLTTYLAELIVARAAEFRADLVWAVAQTPLTPIALEELKALKIATSLWFVEDFETQSYWKHVAAKYDSVFTIQRGAFHSELHSMGQKHFYYLPLAADPNIHKPLALSAEDKVKYGSKTAFVGAGYPNRQACFSKTHFPEFAIWGNDWPDTSVYQRYGRSDGKRVSDEDYVKVFNATDININLHSSNRHAGVNPDGDYVNPRTFEIAACGAFQIVDSRSELAALFESGSEIVTFTHESEMAPLTEKYLALPEVRKQIATRARQRVLKEHTYEIRMQEALTHLNRTGILNIATHTGNTARSLKQAASGDDEVLDFLEQFDDNCVLTLDSIADTIKNASGELTRPEALFLMMREFRDWGKERGVIK